ncbi:MAG: RusA family crossover junction endodeoxyribonuclease [Phascolarctobacterium sp.]
MKLTFTIPGEPTAQGRPRFSTHGEFVKAYDPEKSRNYKAYVKLLASEAMQNIGLTLTELPLGVEIIADVGIPASKSKKFKEQALNGLQLPIKKPDVDNVAKIILDSISGIVYKDDKQIVKLTVSKKYSDIPKVEVKIYNVE